MAIDWCMVCPISYLAVVCGRHRRTRKIDVLDVKGLVAVRIPCTVHCLIHAIIAVLVVAGIQLLVIQGTVGLTSKFISFIVCSNSSMGRVLVVNTLVLAIRSEQVSIIVI